MPTIRDVVQALSRRQGVKAVIVLGGDGLPIDSQSHNALDPDGVAALVPALVSACGSIGAAAACGAFEAGVVQFAGGIAMVTAVTPETLMAIVVDADTNVGPLLYEIRKHRPAIAKLL
jgi:predicted regulator of Ras-like GTPase activity (Roadblock/LC7/MglB family)